MSLSDRVIKFPANSWRHQFSCSCLCGIVEEYTTLTITQVNSSPYQEHRTVLQWWCYLYVPICCLRISTHLLLSSFLKMQCSLCLTAMKPFSVVLGPPVFGLNHVSVKAKRATSRYSCWYQQHTNTLFNLLHSNSVLVYKSTLPPMSLCQLFVD